MDQVTNTQKPASHIKKSGFSNFMSSLWGWSRRGGTHSNDPTRLQFSNVDIESNQRLQQGITSDLLPTGKLSNKLEELFNSWMADTSDSTQEIVRRQQRVNQLAYAKLNDPYIGRAVQLYADEATQMDAQDRIISIDSPNPEMTRAMYQLLNSWGITQSRVRAAIEQLATYGDAFWANKITDKGVERIIPMKQMQVSDRLEFSPIRTLEREKIRRGKFAALADKNALLKQMLDDMDSDSADFADIFDTKLFGYVIESDIVVPPWAVTHFRVNADSSEFQPFGVSPILGTLAPFKLTSSTITLQAISRILSFPVTLYKVKTAGSDPARQFEIVNRVREQYDNIGVNPTGGNSEVYSANTKVWMPEGLMDVDVKEAKTGAGFVEDLKIYQDRTAVASCVPKSYTDQEWGGFGNSALSLTEQYKPFARACFTLQSAFLEGLADLFRLHFAITGQYDYRSVFTLSLKYPAEEISDDKNNARTNSLQMATAVIDMIKTAIGAEEDEGLPPDITRDIVAKYSFLDPVDVMKWTRGAKRSSAAPDIDSVGVGSNGETMSDFDLDDALDDSDEVDTEDLTEESPEEDVDTAVEERSQQTKRRMQEKRSRTLSERYFDTNSKLYLEVLRKNSMSEFTSHGQHVLVAGDIPASTSLMLETLHGNAASKLSPNRLKEDTMTVEQVLEALREDNSAENSTTDRSSEESSTK
jgi:hypothetical protein